MKEERLNAFKQIREKDKEKRRQDEKRHTAVNCKKMGFGNRR